MYKIIPPLQPDMQGKDVANLHEALQILLEYNAFRVNEQFREKYLKSLEQEIESSKFGEVTEQLVHLFRSQYDLLRRNRRTKLFNFEENYTVDEEVAEKINGLLREFGVFINEHNEYKEDEYQVEGTVYSNTSASVGGLIVKVWNKDLSEDEVLGKGVTDRFGSYKVFFFKSFDPDRRGDARPDLQVEVIIADGDSSVFSEFRYSALKKEKIDIVLDDAHSLKLRCEFETITETISNHFDDIGSLKEDKDHQQITYIANKIGWDARLVAMRVLAEKYHQKNDAIPAALFYALFRAGFPSELETLYQIEGDMLLNTWEEAIEKNIIDNFPKEVLEEATESFATKSLDLIVKTEQPILDMVLKKEGQKAYFIKLYKTHQNDMKAFWKETEKEFGLKITKDLKLHTKLAHLTLDNAALIQKLPNISEPKELVEKGFYKAETWKDLLTDEPLPDNIDKTAYAEHMAAHLRLTYPTAVAAMMVKEREFKLESENNKEAVETFLTSHQDKFHIGTQPIDYFVQKQKLTIDEPAKKEIQRMQRLYQVTSSDKEMEILSKNNISSAYQIMRIGKDTFTAKLKGYLDVPISENIFNNARKQTDTAMALLINDVSYKNMPLPYVLKNNIDVKESPTMEKLFYNMDFCSCGHCSSLLSPAAYLVELLEFLNQEVRQKRGETAPVKTPLDILLERRPDLEHIELTCENTKLILPYIDLVNEILEYYVVNKGLSYYVPQENMVLSFEGYQQKEEDKSEDLLANPQNVQKKAYDILKEQVYPMHLSFDKSLEELREYLRQLKVSLYEVMDAFGTQDNLDNEYLGISIQEAKLLKDASEKEIWKYFGCKTRNEMGNAKTMARAIDIKYTDFVDILKTEYVKIKLDIDLKDIKKCDFGKYALKDTNASDYLKLLRFICLWRKLGWSIEALDRALSIKVDNDFTKILNRIASIKRVKTLFHISKKEPFLELLSIWEKQENDSFLIRLFKLSRKEYDTLKDLSGMSNPTKDPKTTFDFIQKVQMVQASGVSVQELQYLLKHEDVTGKGSPKKEDILQIVKMVHDNLMIIENEYQDTENWSDETIQEKISLIYGNEAADKLFRWFNDGFVYSTNYSQKSSELAQEIKKNQKISYDHFAKKLIYKGRMTKDEKDDMKKIPGIAQNFKKAINKLDDEIQKDRETLVELYPELQEYLDQKSIQDLLEDFIPVLEEKEKILSAKQTFSSLVGVDQLILNRVLDGKIEGDKKYYILQSQKLASDSVIVDFLNICQDKKIGKDFYFEVPKSGNYNFYIESKSNNKVELKIDDKSITLTKDRQNKEPIALESGKLYHLTITGTFENLQWHSFGMAKESIPKRYLYASENVTLFSKSYIKLLKVLLFIEKLSLSQLEVIHFSNVGELQFINNKEIKTIFSKIPVQEEKNKKTWKLLFDRFIQLLKYNELKALLKIDGKDLVTLLESPTLLDEEKNSLLLKFTGWSEEDKTALLENFNLKEMDLANWENFLKVQKAYELVKKVALPVKELIVYATQDPDNVLIQKMKSTMEKKYNHPKAWLEVQQKVNDKLRNRQRDALVAYILFQMKQDPKLNNIDTSEKLFEYFLIDVNMDSCWKTSRIKQAISTVQLFIERCLMNLESEVTPETIDKKQWEWMKRYRVWEANRKVFLYPENWMEPELRTDKTPFFQEFESELLQSDITDDLARQALIHYLQKLDSVAKLDISAMHQEYNEDGEKTILHLFGRTPGMSRKYFYRKFDYAIGIWTAWEKVDLNIENNPILPVIWNGCLFLFWLNIVKKGVEPEINGSLKDFAEDTDKNKIAPKEKVEVNLSWCEYYNNKWQPTMTSDFDNPLDLGDYSVGDFNRSDITLGYKLEDKLTIIVWYKDKDKKATNKNFAFFNKYSLPITKQDTHSQNEYREIIAWPEFYSFLLPSFSYHYFPSNTTIKYKDQYQGNQHQLLISNMNNPKVVVSNEDIEKNLEAPFVYQDEKYLFLTQPEGDILPLEEEEQTPIDPPLQFGDKYKTMLPPGNPDIAGVKVTPLEQLTGGGRMLVELSSAQPFQYGQFNIFFKGAIE